MNLRFKNVSTDINDHSSKIVCQRLRFASPVTEISACKKNLRPCKNGGYRLQKYQAFLYNIVGANNNVNGYQLPPKIGK